MRPGGNWEPRRPSGESVPAVAYFGDSLPRGGKDCPVQPARALRAAPLPYVVTRGAELVSNCHQCGGTDVCRLCVTTIDEAVAHKVEREPWIQPMVEEVPGMQRHGHDEGEGSSLHSGSPAIGDARQDQVIDARHLVENGRAGGALPRGLLVQHVRREPSNDVGLLQVVIDRRKVLG